LFFKSGCKNSSLFQKAKKKTEQYRKNDLFLIIVLLCTNKDAFESTHLINILYFRHTNIGEETKFILFLSSAYKVNCNL